MDAFLFKITFEEIAHACQKMVTRVATIDAMVAIGVVVHVELLVGLYQCFRVLHTVAYVYIVVGHAVHEEEATVEVVSAGDG